MVGAVGLLVAGWLVLLSGYDIRQRRLPNRLTLPAAAAVPVAAAVAGHGLAALAGGAALSGAYLLVHLIAPAALGPGTSSSPPRSGR